MKQLLKISILSCIITWLILPGMKCFGAGPLPVFVSVPPLSYIAEQIGGKHVSVHVLVKPGQDPHTFEPTPRQIVTLGNARLFFKVGIPFEARLLKKILRKDQKLKVIDTASGITRRISADHHHQEIESDPHIWLSPPLLKIQGANMLKAYIEAAPDHAKEFQENYIQLSKDIDIVHIKIQKNLKPFAGQSFYVFHPAFGYFGETYGLRQKAVEFEGKKPTPKYLAQLIKQAKAENVKIIFVQPQFDKNSAISIAKAINGAVVEIDPLAENILKNLDEMATKIEMSFSESHVRK